MSNDPCAELAEQFRQIREQLKEAETARSETLITEELGTETPPETDLEQVKKGTTEYDSLVYRHAQAKMKLDECREKHGLN